MLSLKFVSEALMMRAALQFDDQAQEENPPSSWVTNVEYSNFVGSYVLLVGIRRQTPRR